MPRLRMLIVVLSGAAVVGVVVGLVAFVALWRRDTQFVPIDPDEEAIDELLLAEGFVPVGNNVGGLGWIRAADDDPGLRRMLVSIATDPQVERGVREYALYVLAYGPDEEVARDCAPMLIRWLESDEAAADPDMAAEVSGWLRTMLIRSELPPGEALPMWQRFRPEHWRGDLQVWVETDSRAPDSHTAARYRRQAERAAAMLRCADSGPDTVPAATGAMGPGTAMRTGQNAQPQRARTEAGR